MFRRFISPIILFLALLSYSAHAQSDKKHATEAEQFEKASHLLTNMLQTCLRKLSIKNVSECLAVQKTITVQKCLNAKDEEAIQICSDADNVLTYTDLYIESIEKLMVSNSKGLTDRIKDIVDLIIDEHGVSKHQIFAPGIATKPVEPCIATTPLSPVLPEECKEK